MPKQAAFKIGEIVKLKSGGPDMTVRDINGNEEIGIYFQCQWFAGKKLESGSFRDESLVLAEVKQ
jgi:uncharacterized protein YodC (DUF2158 family)